MNHLFNSELRRFGLLAVAVAIVHLMLLIFLSRTSSLLQQSSFQMVPVFALYIVLGLALGFWQIGSYRKPSQWLWLIHRPLPPERIFRALLRSATLLLAIMILLPQLILLIGLDALTTQVVDWRHYASALFLLGYALLAWLIATLVVTARSKLFIAILPAPILFSMHLIAVHWLLWPMLIVLGWMLIICARSFRADRFSAPANLRDTWMLALPMQVGFFLACFSLGQTGFVITSILLGTDPLNTEYPPAGGLIEVERKQPSEAIVLGLKSSRDPRAKSWMAQLPLLEPIGFGPYLNRYPMRHQFGNLQVSTTWEDTERGISWTFSHDRMLFVGRDPRSGRDHGVFGLGGEGDASPFTDVVLAAPGQLLMSRQQIWRLGDGLHSLHPMLQMQGDEWFVNLPEQAFDHTFVMTNKAIYSYRADPDAIDPYAPLLPVWRFTLPRGIDPVQSVYLAELMDGWLLSLVDGDGHRQVGFSQYTTFAQPGQAVYFIDATGSAELVSTRRVNRDYPVYPQIPWWLSPPLHVLTELPEASMDKGLTWPLNVQWWPQAPGLVVVALLLSLISLAIAGWLMRGTRLSTGRKVFWLANCGLLGLPGLLSFLAIEPRVPALRAGVV